MTLVLTVRRLAATGMGGSGSFPALRDTVARVDEMGVRLGSERAAEGIGKPFGIFISSSLLTAFLPDSCFVVDKDTSP